MSIFGNITPTGGGCAGALFHASSTSEMIDVNKTYIDNEGCLWKNTKTPTLPSTNQVPISVDANGSVYNGYGYQTNTYISSNGTAITSSKLSESNAEYKILTTGYIPISSGSVVRLLNCRIEPLSGVDFSDGYGLTTDDFYLTTHNDLMSGAENIVAWTEIESCSWISDIQYDVNDYIYGFTVHADGYLRMTLFDYFQGELDDCDYVDRDDYESWMDDVVNSGTCFVGIQSDAYWYKTGVQYGTKSYAKFVEATNALTLSEGTASISIDLGEFSENKIVIPLFRQGINSKMLKATVVRNKSNGTMAIEIVRNAGTADTASTYTDIYVDYWVLG